MDAMSVSSVALELNGRPLVVRNTFIDIEDDVEQSMHRLFSAPAALSPERSSDIRPEPLSKLRLRLLSRCREEVFDADSCAGSDVEVASSVPTQAPSTNYPNGGSSASTSSSPRQVPWRVSDAPVVLAPWADSSQEEECGSWADCSQECDQLVTGDWSTLMFRNLPESFTRARLEDLLEAEGFANRYDFLYLPANLSSGECFGYALINMVTPLDAKAFLEHFQGFQHWPVPSTKRAEAHMSEELQGLDGMIERYRNSPIMHPSVPDALRPAIYLNGCRSPFPQPTVHLKHPRAKKAHRRRGLAQRGS